LQLDLFGKLPSDTTEGAVCSKCGTLKPLSSFSKASGGNYLRTECKKCANTLSSTRAKLKAKVGSPPEGHSCPICGGDEESVKGSGNKSNGSWVLDHCHDTDEFRGWLCHKCNRGLGAFEDNTDRLQKAIGYLNGRS